MASPLVPDVLRAIVEPLLPPHPPGRRPGVLRGHPVRAEDGHRVGGPAGRDGVRQRHDVLAAALRLARGRRVPAPARSPARRAPRGRVRRLGPRRGRQRERPRGLWGALAGPQPYRPGEGRDEAPRRDRRGRRPAGRGRHGREPQRRDPAAAADRRDPADPRGGGPAADPAEVVADRGYDSDPHRRNLSTKGIRRTIARRGTPHGSGLGIFRWVVERTRSWLQPGGCGCGTTGRPRSMRRSSNGGAG